MSKIKIVLDRKGIKELMQSKEVQDELLKEANEIVKSCEGNYETNVYAGKNRSNASIITRDSKTFFKNLKDNELLKALYND